MSEMTARDRARRFMRAVRWPFAERRVLEALLDLSNPWARVHVGERVIAERMERIGPDLAREMGLRRRRFRVSLPRLRETLWRLRWFGVVRRWWFLPPSGRWVRVLALEVPMLETLAAWHPLDGPPRPWDSRRDLPPVGPASRVLTQETIRLMSRLRAVVGPPPKEHARAPVEWRSQHDPRP